MTIQNETTKLTIVASKELDASKLREIFQMFKDVASELGEFWYVDATFAVSYFDNTVQIKDGRKIVSRMSQETWETIRNLFPVIWMRRNKTNEVFKLDSTFDISIECDGSQDKVNLHYIMKNIDTLIATVDAEITEQEQASEKQRQVNLESSLEIVTKLKELHPKFDTDYGFDLNTQNEIVYIDLGRCELDHLPSIVTDITTLRRLLLDDNNFTEFVVPEGKLQNLRLLSMVNNHLTKIDDSLKGLSNLRTIHLQKNHILDTPEWAEYIAWVGQQTPAPAQPEVATDNDEVQDDNAPTAHDILIETYSEDDDDFDTETVMGALQKHEVVDYLKNLLDTNQVADDTFFTKDGDRYLVGWWDDNGYTTLSAEEFYADNAPTELQPNPIKATDKPYKLDTFMISDKGRSLVGDMIEFYSNGKQSQPATVYEHAIVETLSNDDTTKITTSDYTLQDRRNILKYRISVLRSMVVDFMPHNQELTWRFYKNLGSLPYDFDATIDIDKLERYEKKVSELEKWYSDVVKKPIRTFALHVSINDGDFVKTHDNLNIVEIAEIKRNYDKRINTRAMSVAYHSEPYTPIQEQVEIFENGQRLGFSALGALDLA